LTKGRCLVNEYSSEVFELLKFAEKHDPGVTVHRGLSRFSRRKGDGNWENTHFAAKMGLSPLRVKGTVPCFRPSRSPPAVCVGRKTGQSPAEV